MRALAPNPLALLFHFKNFKTREGEIAPKPNPTTIMDVDVLPWLLFLFWSDIIGTKFHIEKLVLLDKQSNRTTFLLRANTRDVSVLGH